MDVCCSAPFAERNHADIFPRKITKDKGNTSSEKKDIWLSGKRDLNLDLVSLMMHNRIQAVHNSNKAASPTCGNL